MANGTQLAVDHFPGSTLNAAWTSFAGETLPVVSSGVLQPASAGVACGVLRTGVTWPTDQSAEIIIGSGYVDAAGNTINLVFQSGNYKVQINHTSVNKIIVFRGATNLGSFAHTVAPGDIIRGTIFGRNILVYLNGAKIIELEDAATTPGGSPGVELLASSTPSQASISYWAGYNPVGNANGPWVKKGAIINPTSADLNSALEFSGTSNQTVLYDSNPQLISPNSDGKVFKMWFMGANSIYYAESNTALPGNWTRRATPVLTGVGLPRIFKNSSTFYLYVTHAPTTWTQVDLYTSSDGINFTLSQADVFATGVATWENSSIIYFTPIAVISGTWYALYSATGTGGTGNGLATSTDGAGKVWTRYANNPVLPGLSGPFAAPLLVNGHYIFYTSVNSCEARFQSDDFKTVSSLTYSLVRDTAGEGLNSPASVGGVEIPQVIEVNGQCYLFYTSTPHDGINTVAFELAVAVAPYAAAQLVNFGPEYFNSYKQVALDSFQRADGSLGSNWTLSPGSTALQIASHLVEPSALNVNTTSIYSGSSFANDQYCDVTVQTLSDSGDVLVPVVRMNAAGNSFYSATITGPLGSLGQVQLTVNGTNWGPSAPMTPQAGDVFRLSAVGNVVSFFQNGALLLQMTDILQTGPTSGSPGVDLRANTTSISRAQISSWAGGNANVIPVYPPLVWSPVDSRNFGKFPNAGITQPSGAVFYVGQTSSNPKLPPVNSNSKLPPTDSRVGGASQDSRNAPPF